MPRAAVPVLTYHAMRVGGTGSADNDHAAFAADLERLHALGLRVVPLATLVRSHAEGRLDDLAGCVALTLDDGADFDCFDLPHPVWGPQRGMLGILRDFRARHGAAAQPGLHATSFAIVSPQAREELDREEMIGCRWWNDGWWRGAEATGLLAVESHSWDHNQASLDATAATAPKGSFDLATRADADAEIAQATHYLRERRGRGGPVLFAYPYGPASDFLAGVYLPDPAAGHGVSAAFTTGGAPVTAGSSRWRLPRFVCGWHWKSGDELEALLAECGALAGARPAPEAALSPPCLDPAVPEDWRECLRVWEVNDPSVVAGSLVARCGGPAALPSGPRHFVLVRSPLPGEAQAAPRVVAYAHHEARRGEAPRARCWADESAVAAWPDWLAGQVARQGGLAAIAAREGAAMAAVRGAGSPA